METLQDPASGRVFFYNRKDGRTQWERPQELNKDDVQPSPKESAAAAAQASNGEAGMKPILDEGTGRTYYYNTQTGESRWTDPRIASSESAEEAVKKSMWQKIIDEITGRIMFYNAKTMETSWQDPLMRPMHRGLEPQAWNFTRRARGECFTIRPATDTFTTTSRQESLSGRGLLVWTSQLR